MRNFQLLKKHITDANGKRARVIDKFSSLPEQQDINSTTNVAYTTAGAPAVVQIDRNRLLKGVKLRVVLNVTTGATPGTPTARENGVAELLQNLTVKANGKPIIGPMSGRMAFLIAQYCRGREPLELDNLTTTEVQTGSQTLQAIVEIPLDFTVLGLAEPMAHAGAIYSPTFTSLEVSWKWGAVADIMDSPGATQTIVTTSYVEVTNQYAEPERAEIDAEGYGLFTRNGVISKSDFGTQVYKTPLQAGAIYRGLFMLVSGGSTKRVSDAVFTGDIELNVDANPLWGDSASAVAGRTARNMPYGLTRTGFYALDPLKSGGQGDVLPGFEKMWRIPGLRNLNFKANTTTLSAGQIEFCPYLYLPKAEALGLIGAGQAG